MRGNNSGRSTGGINDPVAQNIRNEQNAAAAPSASEVGRMKQKHKHVHAQLKATLAICNHYDVPTDTFTVRVIANELDFSALASKARNASDWSGIKRGHEEPWERPDNPHPRYSAIPGTKVDEKIRELKQQCFIKAQEAIDEITAIQVNTKILNPFCASRARVVKVEKGKQQQTLSDLSATTVYKNKTYEKAMDNEKWSDRTSEERIEEYQDELREML